MRRVVLSFSFRVRSLSAWIAPAVVCLAALCGCSSSEPASAPRSAEEAGRSVFGQNAVKPPTVATEEQDAAPIESDTTPPAESALAKTETSPDSMGSMPDKPGDSTLETPVKRPAAVIAQRPETSKPEAVEAGEKPEAPPGAAAEKMVASASQQEMANPLAGRITDPNADPSQFPGGIVPASPNAEPLPGGPRVLVPVRNFRKAPRSDALQVSYDDLDLLLVLNMGDPIPSDVVDMFPDWLKGLDGKRIRIRGFMYPQFTTRLTGFVLTRDTGVCCFGPNPKVYYLIAVKLTEGTSVDYIPGRPFDVEGTFHIQPVDDGEGNWLQMYSISDAKVIE